MLKGKKMRVIAASVAVMLIVGVTAFAKQINETAEIFYNNIKIYIDGAEIVSKDANGNIVEPFTMNGTTYLPVRAISNAFGKEVEWDGATQSVYIGKKDQNKPDNYLDKIQYTDFKSGYDRNRFYKINGNITDYTNNTYTNGILLYDEYIYTIENDKDDAHILIDYPLNSQYKELCGKIVLPKNVNIAGFTKENIDNDRAINILFFGDDKLLYKATNVTKTMPFSFDIDLTGVNKLTIKTTGDTYYTYVALTDLALYK